MKHDLRYLMAYLKAEAYHKSGSDGPGIREPIITISRQRGALGTVIAHRTAQILNERSHETRPWVVIDRGLAQQVVDDHHLSRRIRQFLSEEQKISIKNRVEEMLGLQSDRWTAIEKMTQTILNLAEVGRVIFVGRGANWITAGRKQAYHVRIIGSPVCRVGRVMQNMSITEEEAKVVVRKCDEERASFVRNYFKRDIDDPLGYDLILSTDRLPVPKAALLVGTLVAGHPAAAGKAAVEAAVALG